MGLTHEKELNYNFENEVEKKLYILLKGFLHRLDHLASAGFQRDNFFDISEDKIDDLLKIFISEKKNIKEEEVIFKDFQNKTYKNKNSDLLSIAFTGSGKTLSDHRWSGIRKFYLVPTRVSAEAFYLDACKIYGNDNVGILHGDSIIYLDKDKSDIEENTSISISEDDFNLTRNLAKPYIVSTIDQILTFLFRFPRYEKIIASLLGSKITIDEVHLLDPYMFIVALDVIKILKDFGIGFHLMTATMPPVYKERIEESKLNFIENKSDEDSGGNLVQLVLKDNEIDSPEIINEIGKAVKDHGKVLIVCNTIKKAKSVYKQLEKNASHLNLLHSLFTLRDKMEKHRNLMDDQNCSGIWICTQMVEVALDIDFPVVFSELAPIENIIQRMGRCNRRNKYDKGVFHVCKKTITPEEIYKSELREATLSVLNKYKDSQLSNSTRKEILEKVYKIKKVIDTLNDEFSKAKDSLRKLFGNEPYKAFYQLDPLIDLTNRYEAQTLFRRSVLPIRVIPFSELNNELESYKTTTFENRKSLYINLLEKTVPLPRYSKEKVEIDFTAKPFPITYAKYNNKTGLDISVENVL